MTATKQRTVAIPSGVAWYDRAAVVTQHRFAYATGTEQATPGMPFYLDAPVSGNTEFIGRPAAAMLLAEICAGRVTRVRIADWTRLGRNVMIVRDAVAAIESAGATVECESDPVPPFAVHP